MGVDIQYNYFKRVYLSSAYFYPQWLFTCVGGGGGVLSIAWYQT